MTTRHRNGLALVLVLLVIVILSLTALTFSRLMFSEYRSAHFMVRQRQSGLLAESGIDYLRTLVMQDSVSLLEQGGFYDNPDLFCGVLVDDGSGNLSVNQYSSAAYEPEFTGRFTILVPCLDGDGYFGGDTVRYGLEDESSKINLRWIVAVDQEMPDQNLGRTILMRLPGVTEEIADSILDWCDSDDDTREFGAEYDYYTTLEPPYTPRNGIPDSIDELLLVCGVTPSLLYGVDWNKNGLLDLGEPDPTDVFADETDGGAILAFGLASLLTVDSLENDLAPDGEPKMNLNSEDTATLSEEILTRLDGIVDDPDAWASAIVAKIQSLQQSSQQQTTPTTQPTDSETLPTTDTQTGGTSSTNGTQTGSTSGTASSTPAKIRSMFDLVEGGGVESLVSAAEQATGGSLPPEVTAAAAAAISVAPQTANSASPFVNDKEAMMTYMPILYDYFTIQAEPIIGRINLNQAPRGSLMFLLPSDVELEESSGDTSADPTSADQISQLIDGIMSYRISNPAEAAQVDDMNYPSWIYTSGLMDEIFGEDLSLTVMQELDRYLTAKGSVYRTQIVGRFDASSPAVRLEVFIDTSQRPGKILRVRELTELGPGYPARILGVPQ